MSTDRTNSVETVASSEAQRVKELFLKVVEQEAEAVGQLLASKEDHELFGETEFQLREIVHRLGAKTLQAQVNERSKKAYQGSSIACNCAGSDRFVNWRDKNVTGVLGAMRLTRPYYHCADCHRSDVSRGGGGWGWMARR